LGILYLEQGRHRDAEDSYQEALEIIKRVLGREHQYYATTYGNLVNIWAELDQYEKALKGYEELVALYENSLGAGQQEYAAVLNNLANLKAQLGDHKGGIKDAEKAIEITITNLGDFHPDLINLHTGLSKLYFHFGDVEYALVHSKLASNLVKRNTVTASGNFSVKNIDDEQIQNAVYFNVALMTAFQPDEKLNEILLDLQLVKSVFGEATLTEMGIRLSSDKKELRSKIRRLQDKRKEYKLILNEYTEYLGSINDSNFQNNVFQIKTNLNRKLTNLIELQKEIRVAFPLYGELVNPQPLSLSDTQDLLGLDEGLFTFVSDEETEATYAVIVTKEDARAYKVNRSEAQIA